MSPPFDNTAADRPLALVTIPREVGAAAGASPSCEVVVWTELDDPARFLAERAQEVRAIVTVGTVPLPAAITAFPMLELVAYFGAGYAERDVRACRDRAIAVSYGPNTNHQDVADLAVGLTIAVVRGIGAGDRLIRADGWNGLASLPMAPALRDLSYGIVGLGAIGTAIAERLTAFGGRIAWWGPHERPDAPWRRADSLHALAAQSDVLLIAVRGDDETRGLIDARVLSALGRTGYLVNVSRGFVVDQPALLTALRTGALAGAGLDVFDPEPTTAATWAGLETVVATPHIGAWTHGATTAARALLAETLRRHFAGAPLLTPVPD